MTPAVKFIIILTTAAWFLEQFPQLSNVTAYLALTPYMVLKQGFVWQLVTYMLVHADPWHLVFNMLSLYFFGSAVEGAWGTKRFAWFYVVCGLGAGLSALFFDPHASVLGASGGVFGVLVAFGLLFPTDIILFFGLIPMRAAHLVMLLIAIEFAMLISRNNGAISSWAHLGGAATGYLYVKFSWRIGNWFKRTFSGAGKSRSVGATPISSRRGNRPSRQQRPAAGGGQVATVTAMPSLRTAPAAPAVSSEEIAIQRRADEVLDKISREGMGSLSREEREILHKHSQILKAREGDVVRLDDYRS